MHPGTVQSPNPMGCGTVSPMSQFPKQNKLYRPALVCRAEPCMRAVGAQLMSVNDFCSWGLPCDLSQLPKSLPLLLHLGNGPWDIMIQTYKESVASH